MSRRIFDEAKGRRVAAETVFAAIVTEAATITRLADQGYAAVHPPASFIHAEALAEVAFNAGYFAVMTPDQIVRIAYGFCKVAGEARLAALMDHFPEIWGKPDAA